MSYIQDQYNPIDNEIMGNPEYLHHYESIYKYNPLPNSYKKTSIGETDSGSYFDTWNTVNTYMNENFTQPKKQQPEQQNIVYVYPNIIIIHVMLFVLLLIIIIILANKPMIVLASK